ncbi:hypothetical protein D3C81_2175910 [compost metagenome]
MGAADLVLAHLDVFREQPDPGVQVAHVQCQGVLGRQHADFRQRLQAVQPGLQALLVHGDLPCQRCEEMLPPSTTISAALM